MFILHCNKCKKLFYLENSWYDDTCLTKGCDGKLTDLDPLAVPALKRFWKLGMDTRFSCSGHYYESGANFIGYNYINDEIHATVYNIDDTHIEGYIFFEVFEDKDTFEFQRNVFDFIINEWNKNIIYTKTYESAKYAVEIYTSLYIVDQNNEIVKEVGGMTIPDGRYSFSLRLNFDKVMPILKFSDSFDAYYNETIAKAWWDLTCILDKAIDKFNK